MQTRNLHSQLNRMITKRLPLALPPNASDPSLYASGIMHFAQIYFTFESLWHDMERVDKQEGQYSDSRLRFRCLSQNSAVPRTECLKFLSELRPDGLQRSPRFRIDLLYLNNLITCSPRMPNGHNVTLPSLHKFLTHIRQRAELSPHILIAYAWVLYMAIFSGGRWIRAQVQSAGDSFWASGKGKDFLGDDTYDIKSILSSLPEGQTPGYLFLHFDDANDGKTLKSVFKERLLEAEHILTIRERKDIIDEALEIFENCILLIKELDEYAISTRADIFSNYHFLGRSLPHLPFNLPIRLHVRMINSLPLHYIILLSCFISMLSYVYYHPLPGTQV